MAMGFRTVTYGALAAAALVGLGLGYTADFALAEAASQESTKRSERMSWTTLGTNSGPVPSPARFEPANLLRYGDLEILIDAGDGAPTQLAKAGVPLAALDAVVISHLHFDHTGGLFALISQRYQSLGPGVLKIYGPPGTRAMVGGLVAAMASSPAAGGNPIRSPGETIEAIELSEGQTFALGTIRVTTAANSHYIAAKRPGEHLSLSFRFDGPDRSIAYTGDTGPSADVERLVREADLLVSEVMDPDIAVADLKAAQPDIPAVVWSRIYDHFVREHLSPKEAGALAQRAGVKALVLTHIPIAPHQTHLLSPGVAAHFAGPFTFARDLDTF